MSGHHEIEIYPDSGIAERGHMPPNWLMGTAIFFLVFFFSYVGMQFWNQEGDLPFFGPGWEVQDQHYLAPWEGVDFNFANASTRRVQASEEMARTFSEQEENTYLIDENFRSGGALVYKDYGMNR